MTDYRAPTISELKTTINAHFEGAFGNTTPVWAKAFLRVLSVVLAILLSLVYKYAASIFLQQFIQYASSEPITINGKTVIPLLDLGRLYGAEDPSDATRAEYTIDVVVNTQGGTLAKDTQYFSEENEVVYLTKADVAIDASTIVVTIKAYSDPDDNGGRGNIGNLISPVGSVVKLVTPVSNLVTEALTTAETVTGADAEGWETYRQRAMVRFRNQPQGGAALDYEQWGEEAEGIINVYPYTGNPGIVELYSEATVASSGSADGIPTMSQLIAVYNLVEFTEAGLATRRPIGSYVYSFGITRIEFDVTVLGIQGATNPTELEEKINEALVSYLWSRQPYISGVTLGVRRDRVNTNEIRGVVQDVCSAYGAIYSSCVVEETGVGSIEVRPLGKGEKAKAGMITLGTI